MNKAITDGLDLMPPPFLNGLDVWSSEDGTPGGATYDTSPDASLVQSDGDFGGALELVKSQGTQRLRYTGETPILPGCYLKVTARVKAMSGNLPSVRIAAWPGRSGGSKATGLVETGPSVALTSYGDVVEVTAIIGSGLRTGVDMPWGTTPIYAHIGLDLTGATGGVVRIDDIQIEDATSVFHRTMMDWVDVRDYGAVGDGVTDDSAAFNAADSAANGRQVLVPAGVYRLTSNVTMESRTRFEGTVSMPRSNRLALTGNFDYPSYLEAFGDEAEAFKRGVQALFNFTDHEGFDLGGRRIDLSEPIDIAEAIDNKTDFAIRRIIRNGQFYANSSSAWNDTVVTSQASYATSNPRRLSNVTNIANIPAGSLVTGNGVGREVYVTSVNIGAGTLELSAPLYDAVGSQTYTFRRFKYLIDLSGMTNLDKFIFSDIDFQCNAHCSAILMATGGLAMTVKDCHITQPKDRGITSHGTACQGLKLDRCTLLSAEQSENVADRTSIALNVNSNDAKLRDNRVVRFKHFAVLGGATYIIADNHWFQGDVNGNGTRTAGIIFTKPNISTTFNGNYIDNNFIEWTNEHDEAPEFSNEFSFGGLTVQNNIFYSIEAAPWFRYLVIKPYGAGHFVQGLHVTGNVFRTVNGNIDRVETVDESFATLDYARFRNVQFRENTYNGVTQQTVSPVMLQFDQNSNSNSWTLNVGDFLPFGGWARNVDSVITENAINGNSNTVYAMPYVQVEQGSNRNQVRLRWPEAVRGRVQITARVDNAN